MQIDDDPAGSHRITGYGDGHFFIDGTRYEGSVVVTPQRVIERWGPTAIEEVDAEALAIVADLDCEVVLLGTGGEHRFPAPVLLAPIMSGGVGVEIMSSDAACRTYNILMSEGRRVAALLIAL